MAVFGQRGLDRSAYERQLADPWNNPQAKPLIRIEGVSKSFGSIKPVDRVSLSIYEKEFFSLLGPSGCGKTTLLRMLAGFERPDAGEIYIDNINVNQTPAYRLPINMVFQSYALFPHMSVEANVGFELRRCGWPLRRIHDRVREMLDLVHLSSLARRRPDALSGGQRQRVALARALASEPKVLLLDEPLGALDKGLREKTQFELVNIQEKVGATFIMVTHDQEEAMTMSSRIGVMEQGQIRQVGTPGEVYEYPNSLSVARFIGSINFFEGMIVGEEGPHARVQCAHLEHDLLVGATSAAPVGVHVSVAVRPEKIVLAQHPFSATHNTARGIVKDIAYLGDVSVYHIQLDSGKMVMATQPNLVRLAERPITWDSHVFLRWSAENSLILAI
jgi:putrescine transport system ATP-binding protein